MFVRLVSLGLLCGGYQQLSIGWQTFRSTDSVVVTIGQRGVVVAGKNWSVDWKKILGAFRWSVRPGCAPSVELQPKDLAFSPANNKVTFEHTPTSVTFSNVKTVDVTFNGKADDGMTSL